MKPTLAASFCAGVGAGAGAGAGAGLGGAAGVGAGAGHAEGDECEAGDGAPLCTPPASPTGTAGRAELDELVYTPSPPAPLRTLHWV